MTKRLQRLIVAVVLISFGMTSIGTARAQNLQPGPVVPAQVAPASMSPELSAAPGMQPVPRPPQPAEPGQQPVPPMPASGPRPQGGPGPQQQPQQPQPPRETGQPVNIKIELTISDAQAAQSPVTKTVTLVVADRENGMIRSESRMSEAGEVVPLHVDANPALLSDGRMRLRLGIAYDLPAEPGSAKAGSAYRTSLRENLSLIVENGKPLVVAQSADPTSDRRVTVEVRATVLK